MSVPFTSPLGWRKEGQDLVGANEIVLAYSERAQALSQSSIPVLSFGENAQNRIIWRAMQDWLETYCTSFIDYINGPLTGLPWPNGFLHFTLATWRAAAGLNPSGFRRSTDGRIIEYGKIQTQDVRGEWCFEDLQKGFSVLRWTEKLISEHSQLDGGGDYYTRQAEEATIPDTITAWNLTSYGSEIWGNTLANMFFSGRGQFDSGPNDCLKGYGRTRITVPTFRPCSLDIYVIPDRWNIARPYLDIEGFGWTQSVYTFFHSMPESSDAVRTSDFFYDHFDDTRKNVCPWVGGDPADTGYETCIAVWLVKWNFTNA